MRMSTVLSFILATIFVGVSLFALSPFIKPMLIDNKVKSLDKPKTVAKDKVYHDKYIIIEPSYDTDEDRIDVNVAAYAKAHSNTFEEYDKLVKSFRKYEVAYFGGEYVIFPVTLEDTDIKNYVLKHSKSRQMYEIMVKSFKTYWVNKPCSNIAMSNEEYCYGN